MLLVAWHCAWLPPPGSCPKTAYLPSQVNDAVWPTVTPANSVWCMNIGSSSEPPSAGSRSRCVMLLPPEQATFMASPRITALSWQAW